MTVGLLKKMRRLLLRPVLQAIESQRIQAGRETQILLSLAYKRLVHEGAALPRFDEIGFRVLSANDEDGILLYIFSLIGTTNRKTVDIGCGYVQGSNTSNLIINHGWMGLLIDGNRNAVNAAKEFFRNCPDTTQFPPLVLCMFVTAENVNGLVEGNGFGGEIDLLSVDLDGMDYWVWKALDCISPRVVVAEYLNIVGADRALTVPYRPDFRIGDYEVNKRSPDYAGASLLALVKLAKQKGYRLVGCNKYCYNAFFVRWDVGEEFLPEVTVESCLQHPLSAFGIKERFPRVRDMEWVEL